MDLLTQLEEKINLTLENYELLHLEIDELKDQITQLTAENASLTENQSQWEAKVKSLLSVFSDDNGQAQGSPQDALEEDEEGGEEFMDEEMAS